MADIAVLVAEEYGRRIKIRNGHLTKPRGEQEREAGVKLVDAGSASDYEEGKTGGETRKKRVVEAVGKWVLVGLEPKSPVGVAACHGFFSA